MSTTNARRPRRRRRREQGPAPLLEIPFRQLRHPLPPYELLGEAQLHTLHAASMHILENVGLDFLDDEVLYIWRAAGARVDLPRRHVWLDRGLVMEAIASAPRSFTWRARNPAHDVFIGQNAIAFGPNGGMAYAADLERGRRPGTIADLQNFLKLSQMCPVLHFASWEQVSPQDIPASTRHLHRLHAALTLTDKPMMEAAHGREISADCLEMVRIAMSGREDLPEGEPVLGDVVNVNSPLRYDERMLGGLLTYARAGQVTFITPFILAGAMSPVTLAAALAQQNAEVLAGAALTQLVRPGAPVIYGGFTTNVDMKSGSPAFGTPESAWALLAGAQLARYYGLPSRGSGALTTAKSPDAQAAYESMWGLWPAIQAHTNLIMHAVGWLDGGLTASFEKFIIDAENLAMFQHFLQGFSLEEDDFALDMIANVGPGGHHFGTAHTQARYKDAFYQSTLADRSGYDAWLAAGGPDAALRAHTIYKELLGQYEPPPIDPGVTDALTAYVTRRERDLQGRSLYE